MTELELDVAHARALAKQVRRNGVPQRVWVDPPLDPRPLREALEHRPDVAGYTPGVRRPMRWGTPCGLGNVAMARFAVESLMTKKVVRVGLDSPVTEVLNKLRAHHISCVVVCEDETPVGMISERDIVGLAFEYVSGKEDTPQLARELMSSSLTTVRDSDSLGDALDVAEQDRVRHLPVVDGDGRLVGLLTQTDLLRARVRQPEENVSHRTG